jgi:uncharacterized protein
MQVTLLWTGREYYSLEHCLVKFGEGGVEISSVIVGQYHGNIYRVEYTIKTTPAWQTISCEVISRHNDVTQHHRLQRSSNEHWLLNGKEHEQFDGCTDVDIPLTPFTNTLPVNRLKLPIGTEQKIKVIYIDLLQQTLSSVHQRYVRTSKDIYHYENIPNDFEADIRTDDFGFVIDYPELFVRSGSWSAEST